MSEQVCRVHLTYLQWLSIKLNINHTFVHILHSYQDQICQQLVCVCTIINHPNTPEGEQVISLKHHKSATSVMCELANIYWPLPLLWKILMCSTITSSTVRWQLGWLRNIGTPQQYASSHTSKVVQCKEQPVYACHHGLWCCWTVIWLKDLQVECDSRHMRLPIVCQKQLNVKPCIHLNRFNLVPLNQRTTSNRTFMHASHCETWTFYANLIQANICVPQLGLGCAIRKIISTRVVPPSTITHQTKVVAFCAQLICI